MKRNWLTFFFPLEIMLAKQFYSSACLKKKVNNNYLIAILYSRRKG